MNKNGETNRAPNDVTKCYICSKTYSSPRVLPCVHTFCLPCLERHGVDKRPGDAVACPLCHRPFVLSTCGFVGLPRNAFVEELAEVDKMARQAMQETQCDACFEALSGGQDGPDGRSVPTAVVHCTDCRRNYCPTCSLRGSLHAPTPDESGVKRHNVLDLATHLRRLFQRGVRYCEQHPEERLASYCYDCRTTLCNMCNLDGTHRIHKCAGVDRAATEFRHQLEKDGEKVFERYRKCLDEADAADRERRRFVDGIEQSEQEIRRVAEEIKQFVDRQANKLLVDLSEIKSEVLQKIDGIRSNISRFLTVSETFMGYSQLLRERGTCIDVATSGDDLVASAAALQTMPFFDDASADYRVPEVTFAAGSALRDMLANDERNVVGRITTVTRYPDGSLSSEYALSPQLIRTLQEDSKAVLGITALSGHVYVVRADTPEVEVYSAATWSLRRRLPVPGLHSATDIVACPALCCLFVSDWPESRVFHVDDAAAAGTNALDDVTSVDAADDLLRWRGQGRAGHRCQGQTNGHVGGPSESRVVVDENGSKDDVDEPPENSWSVGDRPWSLSLVEQQDTSLLVICDQAAKLKQFTLFGSLLRQICLSSELSNPRHAILLDSGQFVVSLGDSICLVGSDGRRVVQKTPKSTSAVTRINVSGRLAIDRRGHILVLDVGGRRVVQFNVDGLRLVREVVPWDDRLRYPARMCLDADRGRVYVADNELTQRSMMSKFWGKTGRVVVYDVGIR